MKTGFLFSVIKTPQRVFKTLLPLLSALLFTTAIFAQTPAGAVYYHPFNGANGGAVTPGNTGPYNVQPADGGGFAAVGLSNSSWTNSGGAWAYQTSPPGNNALQMPNSAAPASITLTFDVASGYFVDLDAFNFRLRGQSPSSANGWSMTINGTPVGSGSFNSSAFTYAGGSSTTPLALGAGFPNNLSGTITAVITLTGGTGTVNNGINIDDFSLTGTVYGAGPDQITCSGGQAPVVALPGTGVTWSSSDPDGFFVNGPTSSANIYSMGNNSVVLTMSTPDLSGDNTLTDAVNLTIGTLPTLELGVTASSGNICPGQPVTINIVANEGFNNINSLQFGMQFDPAKLAYVSHNAVVLPGSSLPEVGISEAASGNLSYAAAGNSIDAANGTVIMSITFNVLVSSGVGDLDIVEFPGLPFSASDHAFCSVPVSADNSFNLPLTPTSTVNAGGPYTTCLDGTVTLAGSGSGFTSYTWSDGSAGGSFLPNANTLNAQYVKPAGVGAGTINLSLTGTGGECTLPAATTSITYSVTPPSMSLAVSAPANANCGSSTPYQILATDFTNLVDIGFSVSWNPAEFDYIGNSVNNQITGAVVTVSGSTLIFAWGSGSSITLPAATAILTINLSPKAGTGSGAVTLTGIAPAAQPNASNGELCDLIVNTTNGSTNFQPLQVTCPSYPDAVCSNTPAFFLTPGTPSTGTFSGLGVNGDGEFDPMVADIGTHTITYSVNSDGCFGSCTFTITVVAAPSAGVVSGPNSLCIGQSGNFTSNVAGGTWSSSDPSIATVDANTGVATAGPNSGTTNIIYSVTGCGGVVTAFKILTVSPVETADAGPDGTTCAGGAINLSGTVAGASTATWSASVPGTFSPSATVAVNGNQANAAFSPAAPFTTGTITFTLTTGGPCSATDTKIVEVGGTIPALGITVTGPSTAVSCGGEAVFNVAVTNFNEIANFQFSLNFDPTKYDFVSAVPVPIAGVGTTVTGAPTFAPGNLGVTWAVGAGATVADNSVILTITLRAKTDTGSGALSISQSPIAYAASNAQLCDVDINGTSSDPVAFAPLAVSCPANQTFCSNVTAPQLLAPVSPGGGQFSYDGPADGLDADNGAFFPSIAGPGTYTVTYLASFGGCINSCTFQVTVTEATTPTFAAIAALCQNATAPALPTTSTNDVTGTWNPATISTAIPGDANYTFTPSAGQCANPTTITVTVNPLETPTFDAIGPLCQGSTPPALPTTSTNGITGTWDAAISTASAGTTVYTFTPTAGLCATTAELSVTVNAPTVPTFDAIDPLCQGSTPPALPTTSTNGITGTWDAAISTASEGTTVYTFTPTAGLCATTAELSVTVNAPTVPTFDAIGPLCQGSTPPALPTTSTNGITGTWDAAISTATEGTTVYTFTPTAGLCATTAELSVTVNAPTVPTFDAIGPLCQDSTPPALPTTSTNGITGTWDAAISTATAGTTVYTFTPTAGLCATTAVLSVTVNPLLTPDFAPIAAVCVGAPEVVLPTTSTNGVSGTWDPATISTGTAGTFSSTFTPAAGQCATSATISVEVTAPTVPTFDAIGPLCVGGTAPALPGTSTNGVTGTWNPATINIDSENTTTYTFTPTAGLCATSATLVIAVGAPVTPDFAAIGTLCTGDTPPVLNTTSPNGISGTWSPATISTSTAGQADYVFTPTAGQCANSITITVTVVQTVTPSYTAPGPLCQNATAPALPTTINGVTGAWSPATINTGTAGSADYTFTPDAGQCASALTITVVVTPTLTPTFDAVGPLCQGAMVNPLPTTSTNGVTGTWDAALSTANAGATVYTFTPDAGQCATTATLSVTVIERVTPTFNPIASVCVGAPAVVLPTESTNGVTGTWNPASISTATAGTFSATFTPGAGECATEATISVTVTPQTQPTFTAIGPLCEDDMAPALPTISNNGITGTWDPAVISTTALGTTTYTFTPNGGQCASTATLQVVVNAKTVPTFNAIGPLCQGAPAPSLPAVSTNGISGTWAPAVINTNAVGATEYVFTPAEGQCATTASITVTVNALQITCPPVNQVLVLNANCGAVLPDYRLLVGVVGNCTAPTLVQTPAPGTVVSGTGTVEVTITATSNGDLITTCNITVTKVDNTLPSVTCTNATVTFDGQSSITLDPNSFVSAASDNCGPVTIAIAPTSVSCAQIGQVVPVVVTVTDVNGNIRICNSTVTVSGLPCNWSGTTGGVGCSGTSAFSAANNTWSQTSNGCYYGPSFTADQHVFAKRTLCGNGMIMARVTSISGSSIGWAGVIMRESSAPGARKVQLVTNLGALSRREVRTTTNGTAVPQQFLTNSRYWLRIVRSGNQFLMSASSNGTIWYPVGATTVAMNACIEVGLVLSGGQPGATVNATFSNVTATGNISPLMSPEMNELPAEAPASIEVFPNPTDGLLNVDISSYAGKPVRIELYNMQGKLLEFSELDEVQAPLQEMDLSKYPGGAYFIRVKSEGLPDAVQRVILGNMWRP